MVSRTNVNDANFPNDWILNNDYKRDLNSEEEAIRDAMTDIYGSSYAYIFAGLTVESSAGDEFLVRAGRARDNLKKSIILPADVDHQACVDADGDNFVAVKHVYTYSAADAAVKTGIAYNRIRADSYLINVAAVAHDENAGWVRLARAYKSAGTWHFDHEQTSGIANYARSRGAQPDNWTIDFVYPSVAAAPVLMNRHGLAAMNLWRVPFDFRVLRVEVDASLLGADGLDIDLFRNGFAHPNWVTITLPAGDTNVVWYNPGGETNVGVIDYAKNDLIQVQLTPVGLGPASNPVALISGIRTGSV